MNDFPIKETFNYLISKCLLETIVGAKVARFGEFAKGNNEVLERFADLLRSLMEVTSFYRFIHAPVNVAF